MREFIENTYGDDLTFIEGFDAAIIGMDETQMRVCYSVTKCIDIILSYVGIDTEEEAERFFYEKIFNAVHEDISIAPTFVRHPDSDNFAFWLN